MFTIVAGFLALLVACAAGWLTCYWGVRCSSASLRHLTKEIEKIIMTQLELSVALDKLTAQVGKVAKEQSDRFDALTAKIKDLTDIIEAGEVTTEVATALANVQSALTAMDEAVPDAPTP